MTQPWTHEQVITELGAYALDALPPDEKNAIATHLATCQSCSDELRVVTQAVAQMSAAIPSFPIDPAASTAIRERLLQRARVSASADMRPIRGKTPAATPSRFPWWLAVAASVAFAVAMYQRGQAQRERDNFQTAFAVESLRVIQLRDSLAERERMLLALVGSDVKVVDLVADNRRPNARMFWAQATNTWTMFAHDFPAPPAGRTYQLWLITRDGQRISAGTFAPDPSGNAVVSAQYALAPDSLQTIAVTDEPAGGVPQPTGGIVIAGEPR